MKYYKALRSIPEGLQSLHATGAGVVSYSPTEPIRAPEWLARQGYHLFVFESFEDIFRHLGSRAHSVMVWEVSVGEQMRLPPFCSLMDLHHGELRPKHAAWPKGTVMTNEITLMRDVTADYREHIDALIWST